MMRRERSPVVVVAVVAVVVVLALMFAIPRSASAEDPYLRDTRIGYVASLLSAVRSADEKMISALQRLQSAHQPSALPDQIKALRSTVLDSESGKSTALEFAIVGDTAIPVHPYGATWDGNLLVVDADGWNVEAHELAGQLNVLLEHKRRPVEDVPLG